MEVEFNRLPESTTMKSNSHWSAQMFILVHLFFCLPLHAEGDHGGISRAPTAPPQTPRVGRMVLPSGKGNQKFHLSLKSLALLRVLRVNPSEHSLR